MQSSALSLIEGVVEEKPRKICEEGKFGKHKEANIRKNFSYNFAKLDINKAGVRGNTLTLELNQHVMTSRV